MILDAARRFVARRHAAALVLGAAALWSTEAVEAAIDPTVAAAIGYTDLKAELGGATPNGAGVTVAHVEASDSGYWLPDPTLPDLAGKTFTTHSPTGLLYSSHGNSVALNFYGTTSSIAGGVTNVDLWEANNWISTGLRLGTSAAPLTLGKVSNHSFGGTYGAETLSNGTLVNDDAMRRLDYLIHRDDAVAVVASNNGSGSGLFPVWDMAFNTLVVGLSNGDHAHGLTTDTDGPGRIRPDIVAPAGQTSFATPIVSAAAAMLVGNANANNTAHPGVGWDLAAHSETIRATLMAGATKTEFGGAWDHTTTRPLDDTYGAGELNVYRSYHIQAAGRQAASNITTVANTGWDFNTTNAGGRNYFFTITGTGAYEVTAVLSWDRIVVDGDPGAGFLASPTTLANLDLSLVDGSGMVVGTQLSLSASTVDNVELIEFTNIAPGTYAWHVTSDTTNIDYGLAWYANTPEPGCMSIVVLVGIALSRRRRLRPA